MFKFSKILACVAALFVATPALSAVPAGFKPAAGRQYVVSTCYPTTLKRERMNADSWQYEGGSNRLNSVSVSADAVEDYEDSNFYTAVSEFKNNNQPGRDVIRLDRVAGPGWVAFYTVGKTDLYFFKFVKRNGYYGQISVGYPRSRMKEFFETVKVVDSCTRFK